MLLLRTWQFLWTLPGYYFFFFLFKMDACFKIPALRYTLAFWQKKNYGDICKKTDFRHFLTPSPVFQGSRGAQGHHILIFSGGVMCKFDQLSSAYLSSSESRTSIFRTRGVQNRKFHIFFLSSFFLNFSALFYLGGGGIAQFLSLDSPPLLSTIVTLTFLIKNST